MIPASDWMRRAMCAALGGPRWDTLTVFEQQKVCSGCPVRVECLTWATSVERGPRHGVIGGRSAAQRGRPGR